MLDYAIDIDGDEIHVTYDQLRAQQVAPEFIGDNCYFCAGNTFAATNNHKVMNCYYWHHMREHPENHAPFGYAVASMNDGAEYPMVMDDWGNLVYPAELPNPFDSFSHVACPNCGGSGERQAYGFTVWCSDCEPEPWEPDEAPQGFETTGSAQAMRMDIKSWE